MMLGKPIILQDMESVVSMTVVIIALVWFGILDVMEIIFN